MTDSINTNASAVEATWEINCDGYYPYCTNCGQEPDWRDVYENGLASICPSCGAIMTNADWMNEGRKNRKK